MGRLDQRLSELQQKQEAVQKKLNMLDTNMEAMGQVEVRNHLTRERKVILRDLTDISIRIRNLQRFKKKEVNDDEFKDTATRAAAISVEVVPNFDFDSEDENFDPEAVQFVHTRPEWRVYPKIALPQARFKWGRVARVLRKRRETISIVEEGQFEGVEEDLVKSVTKLAVSAAPVIPPSATYSGPPLPCICHQPYLLTCSSANCGQSSHGRVQTPCPHHHTDHYMGDNDHLTICKAVNLVVEGSSLAPSVPEQIFTKIKSKPVLERKVFTKSLKDEEPRYDMVTSRVTNLANDDEVLVAEKPGKMVEKPPSTVPRLQKKCDDGAETDFKVGAAMSVQGPVQASGGGGCELLAFRERLRRRLVVAKQARGECGPDVVE